MLAATVMTLVAMGPFFVSPSARDSAKALQLGPEERPNILIIMTDDQRDDLTLMPSTRKLFRRDGVDFSKAFAATPQCCPSRASLMTGRYSHNHGVRNNSAVEDLDHTTTLQRYLQDEGYFTGIFGKFMNLWDASKTPPFFDQWAIHQHHSGLYNEGVYYVNGERRTIDRYATDFVGDRVAEFMTTSEEDDDQPWLMYITPNTPHLPARPKRKYRNLNVPNWNGNPAVFEKDRSDKPEYVHTRDTSLREGKLVRRKQLRSLVSVDDLVERVFRKLGRLNEARDTIAFFTSDNGFFWAEHGLKHKWLPYKQSAEVPLLMRWPGEVASGSRDRRLVLNIDIAPSILDALGIQQDDATPMDGKSLFDAWKRSRVLLELVWHKPPEEVDLMDFVWKSGMGGEEESVKFTRPWRSIRTKRYAYNEYYDEDRKVNFREYYNLRKDPWELDNLLRDGDPSNDHLADEPKAELERIKDCIGSSCP